MDVKIEKDVPLPKNAMRGIYGTIFDAMGIGDSFAMPEENAYRVTSGFQFWAKQNPAKAKGKNLLRRAQGDGTMRFWMIAK